MLGLLLAAALAGQEVSIHAHTPEESVAMRANLAAARARSAPPANGDWRTISSDADRTMAMDVASVAGEGPLRTFWVAYAQAEHNGPPGAYIVVRLELDCESAAVRPRWLSAHAASGASIVGHAPAEDAAPYAPDSGGARMAAVVCEGQPLPGPGFTTHQQFAASITGVS